MAQGLWIKRAIGCWLYRGEDFAAPGHAAGVPMLQLAPRDQDERIVCIGRFIGGHDMRRREPRPTFGSRKAIMEHDGLPRIIRAKRRIGNVRFLQALPCDVVQR